MTIQQIIGKLQEQLNQHNVDLNMFDYQYLRDLVISGAYTLNKEAVNANQDIDWLYKVFSGTYKSQDQNIYPAFQSIQNNNKQLVLPYALYTDVGKKDIKYLTLNGVMAGRVSVSMFFTYQYTEDGMNIPYYAMYDNKTMLIHIPVQYVDKQIVELTEIAVSGYALFEDPTQLPDWNEETSQFPIVSEMRLIPMLLKQILSTISSQNNDKSSQANQDDNVRK